METRILSKTSMGGETTASDPRAPIGAVIALCLGIIGMTLYLIGTVVIPDPYPRGTFEYVGGITVHRHGPKPLAEDRESARRLADERVMRHHIRNMTAGTGVAAILLGLVFAVLCRLAGRTGGFVSAALVGNLVFAFLATSVCCLITTW